MAARSFKERLRTERVLKSRARSVSPCCKEFKVRFTPYTNSWHGDQPCRCRIGTILRTTSASDDGAHGGLTLLSTPWPRHLSAFLLDDEMSSPGSSISSDFPQHPTKIIQSSEEFSANALAWEGVLDEFNTALKLVSNEGSGESVNKHKGRGQFLGVCQPHFSLQEEKIKSHCLPCYIG